MDVIETKITKDTNIIRNIEADIDTYYKIVEGVRLPIKIYKSNNQQKAKTLILTIHGGGWYAIKEDSDSWDGGWMNFQAQYYVDKGYTTAAISYRDIKFCESTTVFDLIEDCKDAVAYLQEKVEYDRLIIIGDSAGGHLAIELGFDNDINVDFVVAANPVLDLTQNSMRYVAKCNEELIKASPIFNIKKTDTKFLILHGTDDTVVDMKISEKFCEKMKACGNDCAFHKIKNAKHAFLISRYESSDMEVYEHMKRLDKYIE